MFHLHRIVLAWDENFLFQVDLFCTNMIEFPELLQSYHQVFNQVIGTDGQEIEMKDKRYVWGYK